MNTVRRAVAQLIALLVASLSFFAVWLIAGTLATVVPGLGMPATGQTSLGPPERTTAWAIVALAGIVAFYASLPVARFIARIFPVKVNGARRYGLILACVVAGVVLVPTAASPSFRGEFMLLVPYVVLATCTLLWTILWQARTTRALDVPFILFLRRFSSFSDRSVLAALLRARPSGYRAAFLAPPVEAAGNFSPMVVAFSGTRLWRPLASCPIPLAARNVEWEDDIEDLARAAACVVIDASDRSPAIGREIEIVQRAASAARVLWLADEAVPGAEPPPGAADQAVRYRRSWRAAALRIVLELSAVGLAAFLIVGPISDDPQFAFTPRWVFWLAGAVLVTLSAPVILQPSVDRKARHRMRDALGAILAGPRARGAEPRLAGRSPPPCVILSPPQSREAVFLAEAVAGMGMRPWSLPAFAEPRSLRDAVRRVRGATLVVADLSTPHADVEYLLGVAHGLGRKVVLVSSAAGSPLRGAPVHRFAPGSPASSGELARLIEDARRDPFGQGPVAALLADEWVFGDRLTGRRIVAFLIDATLSVLSALAYRRWRDLPTAAGVEGALGVLGVAFMILAVYRFLALAVSGTTLGMALAGLRLVDADGGPLRFSQALGRSVGLYVALMPLAGALAALFGPRHQSIEDLLSGTRVVAR